MVTINYIQYCHNRMKRKNALAHILPTGKIVFEIDGEYLSDTEFEEKYPTKDVHLMPQWDIVRKGENPDKTKAWLL